MRSLSDLTPAPVNARTHSAEQIKQIAASIQEWGWTIPILVDEGGAIIAGHGRVEVASMIGIDAVPAMTARGWTDEQKRAYVIADNKLALNAGWDTDLLASELSSLRADGYDVGLTGFSDDELLDLMGGIGAHDAAPPLPEVAFCRPGDVWTLGPHRLVIGDATDPDAYDSLLGSERVDVVWTDPPYNVAYAGKAGSIKGDDQSAAAFLDFLRGAFGLIAGVMKPGAAIYVAHADTEGFAFRRAFLEAGLKLSGVLIWCKDSLVMGRSDYQWQHEPILYGWRPGSRHRWFGGRKLTTLQELGAPAPFARAEDGSWVVRDGDRALVIRGDVQVEEVVPSLQHEPRPRASDLHPTMKPVALIERMLRNSGRTGDLVLDAFGGSGSTLVAADRMGMAARLIELDERFGDVIIRRWQDYTGRRAVRDDGEELPDGGA